MSDCKKTCTQTNVPKVDNTLTKCDECGYVNAECIVLDEALTYIGTLSGEKLSVILKKIQDVYTKQASTIISLQNRISNLENS